MVGVPEPDDTVTVVKIQRRTWNLTSSSLESSLDDIVPKLRVLGEESTTKRSEKLLKYSWVAGLTLKEDELSDPTKDKERDLRLTMS